MNPEPQHDPLAFKEAPALSPASPEAPAEIARGKKRGCLKLGGGCACVGCAVIVVGLAGLILAVMAWVKSSEPYKLALAGATGDPGVRERLGEPVKPGLLVEGSMSYGNEDTDKAEISFSISGPKGSADVTAHATMTGGAWVLTDLRVVISSTGELLVLVGEADAAEEF